MTPQPENTPSNWRPPSSFASMSNIQLLQTLMEEPVNDVGEPVEWFALRVHESDEVTNRYRSAQWAEIRHRLACAKELLHRALHTTMKDAPLFEKPQTVLDFAATRLQGQPYESFCVIWMDSQHRLIDFTQEFKGTINQTSVYPRELIKRALKYQASAVVLVHNHPSGNVLPSRADENLTATLKNAFAVIDVRVLDHIIIGCGQHFSFANNGLL